MRFAWAVCLAGVACLDLHTDVFYHIGPVDRCPCSENALFFSKVACVEGVKEPWAFPFWDDKLLVLEDETIFKAEFCSV